MKDVVEKVLGAEREARERIEQTTSQAAAIRQDADQKADRVIYEARDRASALLRERVDTARAHAQHSLEAGKLEAEAQAAVWYASREALIDALADKALSAVALTKLGGT